jgi:hypothetical protein
VGGVFAAVSRPLETGALRAAFIELGEAARANEEALVRRNIIGLVPGYGYPGDVTLDSALEPSSSFAA